MERSSTETAAGGGLRLLLVGPRRSGRSSVGNTLLGRAAFETRGGADCAAAHGEVRGRRLSVVDARGWEEGEDISRQEKLDLHHALALGEPGPHALLLVLQPLEFGPANRAALRDRMDLLTPWAWRHSVVVFTLGDRLRHHDVSEYVRAAGPDLQWLMGQCQNRYHVLNNRAGGDPVQAKDLLEKVEDMVLENGGWHFSLHMYRRVEERWSRREMDLLERMKRVEEEKKARLGKGGAWLRPYPRRAGVPHVSACLLKSIGHG